MWRHNVQETTLFYFDVAAIRFINVKGDLQTSTYTGFYVFRLYPQIKLNCMKFFYPAIIQLVKNSRINFLDWWVNY